MLSNDVSSLKQSILTASFEEDQARVIEIWQDTFLNNRDDPATQMMRLVAAAVYRGDFKTRSSENHDFSAPNDVLYVADYLSHASRIVLDGTQLSEENLKQFLDFFKKGYKRPASHYLNEVGDEKKTVFEGLKNLFRNSTNFGINIAMGGQGNQNIKNTVIKNNGSHGHVYYHRSDSRVMIGLEQTSPWISESAVDLFDQKHSITGASDTFTSAHSLYFNNPVYWTKLFNKHQCLPPTKYDGMRVFLTNDNWPNILRTLETLKETPKAILGAIPSNAQKIEQNAAIETAQVWLKYFDKNLWSLLNNTFLNLKNSQTHQVARTYLDNIMKTIDELKKNTGFSMPLYTRLYNELKDAYDNLEFVDELSGYCTILQQFLNYIKAVLDANTCQSSNKYHETCDEKFNIIVSESPVSNNSNSEGEESPSEFDDEENSLYPFRQESNESTTDDFSMADQSQREPNHTQNEKNRCDDEEVITFQIIRPVTDEEQKQAPIINNASPTVAPDKTSPYAKHIKQLEEYITVRKNSKYQHCPGLFSNSFIFFKSSRGRSQLANVLLAETLKNQLETGTLTKAALQEDNLISARIDAVLKEPTPFSFRNHWRWSGTTLKKIVHDLEKDMTERPTP